MDIQNELAEALKLLFKKANKVTVFPATVKSVSESDSTVTVFDGDLELYDVRLKAAIDNNSQKVILIPKENSSVLIANIGTSENAFVVISVSEIKKIVGKIGTTEFQVNENGYEIKRAGQNLKTVLNDLVNELKQAQVITPAGNGTFLPSVITNLTLIQNRLNQILT